MRKRIFVLIAMATTLCACNKIENTIPEVQTPEGDIQDTPIVFTATMEGAPETRATYDGTYKCASWEVDDRISINGFDYKANNAGTSTTFSPVVEAEEIRPTFVSSTNTGSYQNQPAQNLVDEGGVATRWIANKTDMVNGVWNIVVTTGKTTQLKSIKLWNHDNQQYPGRRWKSMKLYGSTSSDGEWTEIQSFSNLNLAENNRGLAGEIAVNATEGYTHYRIDVLDNEGDKDGWMQMADMKFVVNSAANAPYDAYFPASLYDGTTAVLPANITETWADGKFNMPMYAHSENTDLSFKNLCGVLKITVKSDQIAAVKNIRVSSANKAVSGTFTVNANNAAVLSDASTVANTLTITYTEAVPTTAKGKVFYVAVPAQTYQALKIELDADGNGFTKSMTTKSATNIIVERNKIYPVTFADNAPTKGTAKATINGSDVDVNWVQLWAGGPKFAEYNVGANSATGVGTTMTFANATKTGDKYEWGANWCTPSKGEMDELLKAATSAGSEKVTCTYTEKNGVYGFEFTGSTAGYESNSVFFPAPSGAYFYGVADYWSATANDSKAWLMHLSYDAYDGWYCIWQSLGQAYDCLVRPVLKN